jgi:cholesterol oxidase
MIERGDAVSYPLSSPLDDQTEIDTVAAVVGSGFGGAVAAARLAPELGADVMVFERGREIPLGGFPRNGAEVAAQLRTPANPLGLFDVLLGLDLDVLMASALGGGSQIYAGVTLPPPDEVFTQADGHRRIWPEALSTEALAPYYDTVRQRLAVEPWLDSSDVEQGGGATPIGFLGGSPARDDAADPRHSERVDAYGRTPDQRPELPKADPVRAWASRHSGSAYRPPLAISLTAAPSQDTPASHRPLCIHCGCCVTGCNVGAKNTLTSTYLADAVADGARIACPVEVTRIRRGTRRRWLLEVVDHSRPGRRISRLVHADLVVVCAGAVRSVELLLRSAREFPMSRTLGARVSANGDAWIMSYDGDNRLNAAPVGRVRPGPTITICAEAVYPDTGPMLVQDGAFPASTVTVASRGLALASGRPGTAARKGRAVAALSRSQVWLAMGLDSASGTASLDRKGRVRVRWPGLIKDPAMRRAEAALGELARMEGARAVVPPRRWGRGHTPTTVHPLGGCAMSDSVEHGVVDDAGRVYHLAGGVHRGLYVLDGSVCPTALGSNPSLAIAALTERAMQEIVATDLGIIHPAAAVT